MKKVFHLTEKQPTGPENGPVFLLEKFPYGSNMGQKANWTVFGFNSGQKEIPKNGGVKPFLGICLVRVFITDLTQTQKA